MIWLLPTPPPTVSKLSLFHSILTGVGGRRGWGRRPNITARKHGPLYMVQYSLMLRYKNRLSEKSTLCPKISDWIFAFQFRGAGFENTQRIVTIFVSVFCTCFLGFVCLMARRGSKYKHHEQVAQKKIGNLRRAMKDGQNQFKKDVRVGGIYLPYESVLLGLIEEKILQF
jgi:hypothetical protein